MARKPTGGTGSNQYVTRGQSRTAARVSGAEVRQALEAEQVAAAFGAPEITSGTPWTAEGFTSVAAHGSKTMQMRLISRKTTPPEVIAWLADHATDPK